MDTRDALRFLEGRSLGIDALTYFMDTAQPKEGSGKRGECSIIGNNESGTSSPRDIRPPFPQPRRSWLLLLGSVILSSLETAVSIQIDRYNLERFLNEKKI